MTPDRYVFFGFILYLALFIIGVALFALWHISRRKVRAPLEFKLLRAPGESLRRRMAKFDEDSVFRVTSAALAPVFAVWPAHFLFTQFKPTTWPQLIGWLVAFFAIFATALWFSFRWAVRDLFRYRNDRLGYLGERAVGEALEALRHEGYAVFHDIPADAGGYDFNVDHVAVGTNGVFAIETKTRRKGRARLGFEDYKVAYDGRQLIWPWGEDAFGLKNAEDRSRWLTEWLNKMTGLALMAKPVLVLPGWYVVPKGIGPVTVVNHKQVAGTILKSPRGLLTDEQVALIARQLDERCRDVED